MICPVHKTTMRDLFTSSFCEACETKPKTLSLTTASLGQEQPFGMEYLSFQDIWNTVKTSKKNDPPFFGSPPSWVGGDPDAPMPENAPLGGTSLEHFTAWVNGDWNALPETTTTQLGRVLECLNRMCVPGHAFRGTDGTCKWCGVRREDYLEGTSCPDF